MLWLCNLRSSKKRKTISLILMVSLVTMVSKTRQISKMIWWAQVKQPQLRTRKRRRKSTPATNPSTALEEGSRFQTSVAAALPTHSVVLDYSEEAQPPAINRSKPPHGMDKANLRLSEDTKINNMVRVPEAWWVLLVAAWVAVWVEAWEVASEAWLARANFQIHTDNTDGESLFFRREWTD